VARGVDGLTVSELRDSREFWDDRYTRELLDGIPPAARTLVEIGCGLARAAHELLPHRPELGYLGVDVDGARLAVARGELAAAGLATRARLARGDGRRLPLCDGAADAVLMAMALQHVADPAAVLAEAHRVLAPGGALVAVEPDYAGQRLYFDGPLDEVNAAFAALRAACKQAKRPADHDIGPRVAALVRATGFGDVRSRVHALQGSDRRSAASVVAELLERKDTLAGSAGISGEVVQACERAVDRWLLGAGGDTSGHYAWFVPVFVTRGVR